MAHERVYVQQLPLPISIAAMVTKVFDESTGEYYVISVNDKFCKEKQQRVLCHEMEHIYYGDYESMLTADQLEFISLLREDVQEDFEDYVEIINDPFIGDFDEHTQAEVG